MELSFLEWATFPATISNSSQKLCNCCCNCSCFCCNCCFLFGKCAREGSCQGASGLAHSSSLWVVCVLGGTLLLNRFLDLICHSKLQFGGKLLPEFTRNIIFRKLFFRKSAKTKTCVWTAPACTDCIWAHPVERSGRPNNRRKKGTYFRTPFFTKKYEN